MKVLLTTLNSKYIHSNLALRYLYAVACDVTDNLCLREFTINNDDDYIFGEIILGEYEIICFSCYIWNIERILNLSGIIKKAKPQTVIVLGGPEAAYSAAEILNDNPAIDFIISGEGETAFPELLRVLTDNRIKRPIEEIKGLVYRESAAIHANAPASAVDFRLVPFPYRTLAVEADKIIYYESSRGCPFNCSYCMSSLDKGIRALPMERVKQDLSYFIHKKFKQVKFVDRTFNYDKDRATEIFEFIIANDNGITNFHFEICGELMNEEMLSLLERVRPGLFQFEIGVQSTNQRTLKAINRTGDFSILSANVRRLKDSGNFHLHLDLIAGLPYEDYNSFRQSFNDVYNLHPDQLQLGFLKLLPGTQIREKAEEYSYVYREKAPYEVISNRFISAHGFVRLKMIEKVLNLYYNRDGFSGILEFSIRELGKEAFDFYEEFANFYYLKGFQHKSHKKEDLYRIIRLYGWWKDRSLPGIGGRMEEMIIRDMNRSLNPDAVKKFFKKGWALEG